MVGTPLFIVELITSLNLGEQVFAAIILLFVAFEVTRVLRVGRKAGKFVGGAAWYGIVLSVALAGAILLGWVDPNAGKFVGDVSSWGSEALDWISEKVNMELPI